MSWQQEQFYPSLVAILLTRRALPRKQVDPPRPFSILRDQCPYYYEGIRSVMSRFFDLAQWLKRT